MKPELCQARSLDNLQLDLVQSHQTELRREIEALRSARAVAASRVRSPHRSLARVAASWLASTCTRGRELRRA
jgi:phosphoribosylanthranilate isomerase